jgi:hypothetical protein
MLMQGPYGEAFSRLVFHNKFRARILQIIITIISLECLELMEILEIMHMDRSFKIL